MVTSKDKTKGFDADAPNHAGAAPAQAWRVAELLRVLKRARGAVIRALRSHWPEYLCEALGLGIFMVSACLVTCFLESPGSPVHEAISNATLRRMLVGAAMGLTAIAIIYSPFGKRSGAHINPAVTMTFYRLGRVAPWDAAFYVLSQFVGGALGVVVSFVLAPSALKQPAVHFVVTSPGDAGLGAAAMGEAIISFLLMFTVLAVGGSPYASSTGLIAGCLVAVFVAVEAPYSGMSMNPARSAASAIVAADWRAWWMYFVVPPLSMLAAAQAYLSAMGRAHVACAKLQHSADVRCIFCGFVPSARQDHQGPTSGSS
ncbi:MAG: aquaporin [Polyangiaceae bacterium]